MTRFILNGEEHTVTSAPDTPLLWVIRDELGFTGTKYGCGAGLCGACHVHVDGELAASCQTPLSEVDGKSVTTIEGLSGKVADALFAAWEKNQAPQCGYCQPGQIMTAAALLAKHPNPTDELIESGEWLGRNVCRCATYGRIRKSIHEAAKSLEG